LLISGGRKVAWFPGGSPAAGGVKGSVSCPDMGYSSLGSFLFVQQILVRFGRTAHKGEREGKGRRGVVVVTWGSIAIVGVPVVGPGLWDTVGPTDDLGDWLELRCSACFFCWKDARATAAAALAFSVCLPERHGIHALGSVFAWDFLDLSMVRLGTAYRHVACGH
jgi:hypothetical protein